MIALGFQPVFNILRAREHYIDIIYVEYTFGLMKRAKQQPCLAGLAPESHAVKISMALGWYWLSAVGADR